MKRIIVLLVLIQLITSLVAKSQSPFNAGCPGSLTITMEQDFLLVFNKNEDRNYTQGTSFTLSRVDMHTYLTHSPQKLVFDIADRIFTKNFDPTGGSFSLLGTSFTPEKIDSVNPIIGDRPFAFLLGIATSSTYKTLWNHKHPVYHSLGIHYGIVGTDIGYKAQRYIHTNVVRGRPANPVGWDHQLAKGGRFTGLISYNRLQTIVSLPSTANSDNNRVWFDLSLNCGGSYGFYDRLYLGASIRLGRLRKEMQIKWNTNSTAVANANYQSIMWEPMSDEKEPSCKFCKAFLRGEQFIFFSSNATAMFRNSFLVGQKYGADIYRMATSWTNKGIFEYEYGIVINWEIMSKEKFRNQSYPIALVFKQVSRSPEFDSGLFPRRWHHFGACSIVMPLQWL